MNQFGLVGLGVMGRALAENARDHGRRVIGWDTDPGARAGFLAAGAGEVADGLADLATRLAPPRLVLLLAPAGPAVDAVIAALGGVLAAGDVVVDGGNSHWRDGERRAAILRAAGIGFVGLGVSGGEHGARHGPAMMAGGDEGPVEMARALLAPLAARVSGRPCFDHFGGAGSGHFVKMVHNGIEYSCMQMIAEACFALRHGAGLSLERIASLFEAWNDGPLGSYLLEITAGILRTADPETGRPLLDVIEDGAGQKGTGYWAVASALEMGVAVPCMAAAVNARHLSAGWPGRRNLPARPIRPIEAPDFADAVRDALRAGQISAYAEGFAMLADPAKAATNWRGGCIIRARLLDALLEGAPERMADPDLAPFEPGWRRTVLAAIGAGLPLPALTAALDHWTASRAPRLWTDLVQAQRDRFGAHGFRRVDRDGTHHGPWGAAR